MVFTCPECGTRQRGGAPGAIVPCMSCRNPIVVPEPLPPREEPPPPVSHALEEDDGGPGRLWATATLVLVIVAAAHAGLYLLLTADARGGLRTIEARHPLEALRTAQRPERGTPQPGTPAYTPWREGVELWNDAQAWNNHRRHVSLLRTGFLASFLVQVGITLWILMKVLGKQKKRDAYREKQAHAPAS